MGVRLDDHPVGLDLIDHSAAVEGGIVPQLFKHYLSTCQRLSTVNHGYYMSFGESLFFFCQFRCGESLSHPGPKCALIVRFFLDCFIQPSSVRDFLEQVVPFAGYQPNTEVINTATLPSLSFFDFSM